MVDELKAALNLIRAIERKPWLLEEHHTGAALSIELAEATLTLADDAVHNHDLDMLAWLCHLLIYSFLLHQPPNEDGASFIDLYEYLTDLYYFVEDNEDPFRNPVVIRYRESIAKDLEQVRNEVSQSQSGENKRELRGTRRNSGQRS